MKMEQKFREDSLSASTPVALDVLHFRMAVELCELTNICSEVENALGDVIENPGTPLEKPIVTLQGLDRLRQSLEDLARLAKLLSNNNQSVSSTKISANDIRENIVLGGLAERLISPVKASADSITADQDVIWKL